MRSFISSLPRRPWVIASEPLQERVQDVEPLPDVHPEVLRAGVVPKAVNAAVPPPALVEDPIEPPETAAAVLGRRVRPVALDVVHPRGSGEHQAALRLSP